MISLLLINYRSAGLAIAAMRSARAATSGPLQIVAVDNSVDPAEAEQLRPHADRLVVPPRNLGYAGGINAGRAQCDGEILIVTNPDVVFAAESIDRLVAALRDPAVAVAGPALFWDAAHEWFLPPADDHSLLQRIDDALATRWGPWFRWRDRRRFHSRLRFWSLREPAEVPAISGAVMAIRAADFDAAGGFDERFELYFEETDFLRRLRKRGRRILYIPAASCQHVYNQSAASETEVAARRYDESQRRFLVKWYGPRVAAILRRLERSVPRSTLPTLQSPLVVDASRVVVEASPLPSFVTAAGHFPKTGEVEIPPAVWDAYRGAALYLRAVERDTARVVTVAVRHGVDKMPG